MFHSIHQPPFKLHSSPANSPKPVPRPGGKHASTAAVVSSLTNPAHKGFGLFRGFISTRVPKRGDLTRAGFANLRSPESSLFGFMTPYSFFSYTHLVIRFRGDGRNYRINILPTSGWDEKLLDGHQFILYTRGGPYWETAKIPLSKLFVLNRGRVRTDQFRLNQHQIRLFSLTLMDQIDGPFSLELDYIGLYCDRSHTEQFAYEKYDRTGIVR